MRQLGASNAKKRQVLANKIIKEHFEITLHIDRNINYLWYMYYKGSKKGTFRDFIFAVELNMLRFLNIISDENKKNIINMLNSEDEDNAFLAILSIDNFRKERIKIHGEVTPKWDVSDELKSVSDNYINLISQFNLDKL